MKYNGSPSVVDENRFDLLGDFNIPAMNRKNDIVNVEFI